MLKAQKFLSTLILLLIACSDPALSADLLEDWQWAKEQTSQHLLQMRSSPANRNNIFWRDAFMAEKKRLQVEPSIVHQFPLEILDEPQVGVSPYGKIWSAEKLKKPMSWAFRFHEDKRILVENLPGDRWGTRLLTGPYGDVEEISEADAKKKYGLVPLCHPSRVFLLKARNYDGYGN